MQLLLSLSGYGSALWTLGGLSHLDQTFVDFLILLSRTEQAFLFLSYIQLRVVFFFCKVEFTVLFYLAEPDMSTQKKDKHR